MAMEIVEVLSTFASGAIVGVSCLVVGMWLSKNMVEKKEK
jgi:hypothetical protein